MFTIALIGGDGAGKTTIAKAVINSSGLPLKYLYMGMSTRSSNHALLTSRFVLFFKQQMYKKAAHNSESPLSDRMSAPQLEYFEQTHSWLWNFARFLNRWMEAWYRQLFSISYQMRGYGVLYDRHYFFDSAPIVINSQESNLQLFDHLYFWLISHLYPKPYLTIFLDAPPELLFQRKGEATPEYLEKQRAVYLEQAKKVTRFIRVDATQPLEKVIDEVLEHIKQNNTYRSKQIAGTHVPNLKK